MSILNNCILCPRQCGVDRTRHYGRCGVKDEVRIAKVMLHKWEEPCISVRNGAGTIFFSGCSLHCCYCQNHSISSGDIGTNISIEKLSDIFISLQERNADNIELVTPTHFVPQIISALDKVKHKLKIPVVYNTGGYELTETIDMLQGYVDVYLPDLKYFSPQAALRYSEAADYFKFASQAILRMAAQSGKPQFSPSGAILKGTIIRHLVLPGLRHDSMKLLEWIAGNFDKNSIMVSLMSQYTPLNAIADKYAEIKRRVTKMEYNSVVKRCEELGLSGFTQSKQSASESYIPDFDLSGIL